MRLYASIVKTFKEVVRDWKVLSMVLAFAPFFVLLMKLFYGGDPTTYKIGIINSDQATLSAELIQSMENAEGDDHAKLFRLQYPKDLEELKKQVEDKTIDIGIVLPDNYSKALAAKAGTKEEGEEALQSEEGEALALVEVYGSMGNAKYMVAAVLANNLIYQQEMEVSEIKLPVSINETFLEKKQVTNEFDSYVPGLISMAVLMILFTATATIVKENDKNTLIRLKMSRLGALRYLLGVSIVEALVAVTAMVLTYWTAILLGYKPLGTFPAILAVGIISSFSMVAVSLIMASFLNTIFDVLTIGCFPFFLFMFFSGSMFPLPKVTLFTLAGRAFGATDILSLSFTAASFNKILNYGVGLGGVSFEILMISLLTFVYFAIGLFLYQKRRLSRA